MTELALLIPPVGIGDRILMIPCLKKLKEKFGKFDVYYWGEFELPYVHGGRPEPEFPFFDEREYVKNYRHVDYWHNAENGEVVELYSEIRMLMRTEMWERVKIPEHVSILMLKQLNLEWNDDSPEKEIEIKIPQNRVDEYAHFNDYFVIAPGHYHNPPGRFYSPSIYCELVERYRKKGIKFITLSNYSLPYETETFWTDDFDQLQMFLKSVRGVVTIDSAVQHYCAALKTKAVVLWGKGASRPKKYGHKLHINYFKPTLNYYDDLPTWQSWKIDPVVRFDIDQRKFFKYFEQLIEDEKII